VISTGSTSGDSNSFTGGYELTETSNSQTVSDAAEIDMQNPLFVKGTHSTGNAAVTTPTFGNSISGTAVTTDATSNSSTTTTCTQTNDQGSGTTTTTVTAGGTTDGDSNSITGDFSLTQITYTSQHAVDENSTRTVTTDSTTPGSLTAVTEGNNIFSTVTTTTNGLRSTSLYETGSNAAGAYTVTQTMQASPVVTETRNSITGTYTLVSTGVQTYTFDQQNSAGDGSGNGFSTHETGSDLVSTNRSSNMPTGNYAQATNHSDNFQMTQTGSTASSQGTVNYTQTLTALDSSVVLETGNTRSGDYQRNTNGTLSSGELVYSGTNAGTPFNVTTYPDSTYGILASGNPTTNTFDQTKSGTNRYDLLQQNNDPSNTNGANGDGDVESSPTGAPLAGGGIGLVVNGIPVGAIVVAAFGGLPEGDSPSLPGYSSMVPAFSLGLGKVPDWLPPGATVNKRTVDMLQKADQAMNAEDKFSAGLYLQAARQAYTEANGLTFQDAEFRAHQKKAQAYAENPTNPVGQAYKIRNDAIDGFMLADLKNNPKLMRAYVDYVGRTYGSQAAQDVMSNINLGRADPGIRADKAFWFDSMAIATVGTVLGMAGEFGGSARQLKVGQAGRFSTLDELSITGDQLTPHHMPQGALGFTAYEDGGAIVLRQADHELTRTYFFRGAQLAKDEAALPFRVVLGRDIRDLRMIGTINGIDYDQGIRDLLAYYRREFPSLIERPPLGR
jgi:hypothetical protein